MISSPKEMLLQIGDVVKYPPDLYLCHEFVDKYGRGPFIISGVEDKHAIFDTMDGKPVIRYPETYWTHTCENLILDQFLTAVRRARYASQV